MQLVAAAVGLRVWVRVDAPKDVHLIVKQITGVVGSCRCPSRGLDIRTGRGGGHIG